MLPTDLTNLIVEFRNPHKNVFDVVLRELLWEFTIVSRCQPITPLQKFMSNVLKNENVFIYLPLINCYFDVIAVIDYNSVLSHYILLPVIGRNSVYTEQMKISKDVFVFKSQEMTCVIGLRL